MEICTRGKTTFRLADHYPAEMREIGNVQIGDVKHFQTLFKGSGAKVHLVKDDLRIGSQINK